MELIIKFILALVVCGATTILIFTLFEIPIKSNDKQIAIFALIVGFVNFYFKFILDSSYVFAYQIISFIVLLVVLRRYPILYAIILTITGYINSGLVDVIASTIAKSLNITVVQMINDFKTYVILHTIVSATYLLIALILKKYGLSYSFVKRRFLAKGWFNFTNVNYIWAVLLIVAVIAITAISQPDLFSNLKVYVIILIALLSITSIFFAYKQNKLSLADRYGSEGDRINK